VDVDPRPNHLNSVSISYSHLFPRLYDFIWYESYRLTSIFDFLPIIFWFTYPFATSIMIKIKMPTNIHRVPFFFFLLFSHPSTLSHPIPELFLFSHTRESLSIFVKMTCCTAIVFSTRKYHPPNSLLLKKKYVLRGFMLIVG